MWKPSTLSSTNPGPLQFPADNHESCGLLRKSYYLQLGFPFPMEGKAGVLVITGIVFIFYFYFPGR